MTKTFVDKDEIMDYKCQSCKEKQMTAMLWEVQSIGRELDLSDNTFGRVQEGESENDCWACPTCGENLPEKLVKKLKLWNRI